MQIRRATLNDIPQIMQAVSEVVPLMQAAGNFQWDHTYPNPQVFTEDIGLRQLWVADMDGDIGGVAAITTEQYPEYAQAGLDISQTAIVVHRLVVSPCYQGRGIAKALLEEAEAEANRRGIKFLRIDTNLQNKSAQALFPKLGYVFAGEIGLEFRPGLRFVCFEKKL
ncbi:GNAT family N-acetyltransferase [Mucilaginibacter mali]|uniref:GNAT family N-acetyltransferase n=1 Tax=Mucilaginibacter mali TaxID=2740462 RepID=A0A7D4PW24_9SPHI|nr:GNAT family N-acetyltransferase [Mucilaginibacter mali]QKJ32108.1 GNAT family N-acetyltransferase [Mucilaginibacter mali]